MKYKKKRGVVTRNGKKIKRGGGKQKHHRRLGTELNKDSKIWSRSRIVGRRERARRHQRDQLERRAEVPGDGIFWPSTPTITFNDAGEASASENIASTTSGSSACGSDPSSTINSILPSAPRQEDVIATTTTTTTSELLLSPPPAAVGSSSSSSSSSSFVRHDLPSHIGHFIYPVTNSQQQGHHYHHYHHQQDGRDVAGTGAANKNNNGAAAVASMATVGNGNGRERDRVSLDGGGGDGVGGRGGRGGGGPLGKQRIVAPSGEGRGGGRGGSGGGRIVDGRGGGVNSRDMGAGVATPRDMEETCRRICKTLKEDCEVG